MNQNNNPILFSDQAIAAFLELYRQENNSQYKLRIFVAGGSCAGVQFGMEFDDVVKQDDIVIEKIFGDLDLLLDLFSYQYVQGAEVDYKTLPNGEWRFSMKNQNVQTRCQGCGGH